MSLRSALTRLAIVTAAGALAASAAVTPALADGGDGVHAQQGGTNDWQNEGGDDWQPGGGGGDGGDDWQPGGGGDGWQSGNQNGNQSGGNQNGNQSGGNQWQSGGGQSGGNQWQSGGGQSGGNQWQSGGGQSGGNQWHSGGDQSGDQNDGRRSRGRVTASELLLRSAPTRASQVIRAVHRGDIVSIFCRTSGQDVQGNTHWYLLTDGTWAWGSARYIETIGAAPRWC